MSAEHLLFLNFQRYLVQSAVQFLHRSISLDFNGVRELVNKCLIVLTSQRFELIADLGSLDFKFEDLSLSLELT